jgi:hypothetical protein
MPRRLDEPDVDERRLKSLILRAKALTKALEIETPGRVLQAGTENAALDTLDSTQEVRVSIRESMCLVLKKRERAVARRVQSCVTASSDCDLCHDSAGRGKPEASAFPVHP